MKCSRSEKYIALAAGGDLAPRQSRRLESHLKLCGPCREFAEDMRAAREVWTGVPDPEEAELAAVRARVMAAVAQAQPARTRWTWALMPVAAVAALLIVLLWPAPEKAPLPHGRGSEAVARVAPPPAVEPPPAPRPVVRRRAAPRRPEPPMRALPPAPGSNDVLVKYKTSDPSVVVYWAYETTGETE